MEEYCIGEPDYRTYARHCRQNARRLSEADRKFIEAIKTPEKLNERDKERLCFVFACLESSMMQRSFYEQ